jgi:hypothetical protein
MKAHRSDVNSTDCSMVPPFVLLIRGKGAHSPDMPLVQGFAIVS